jgi:hypothetical protein
MSKAAPKSSVIRTLLLVSGLLPTKGLLNGCSTEPNSKSRSESGSGEALPIQEIEIPLDVSELRNESDLALLATRISFAKFSIKYVVGTDPKERETIAGFDIKQNPPTTLKGSAIKAPVKSKVTIKEVRLIDFATNNPKEPIFVGLTDKIIPEAGEKRLALNGESNGIAYDYELDLLPLKPFTAKAGQNAFKILYRVFFEKTECLSSNQGSQTASCKTGGDNIGPKVSGGFANESGQFVGLAPPKVTWNKEQTKVIELTSEQSDPQLGTVEFIFDCIGTECPTTLLPAQDSTLHQYYLDGQRPSTGLPQALGKVTFQLLDKNAKQVSDPLAATLKGPKAPFKVSIKLEKIALRRFSIPKEWKNDFQFSIQRLEAKDKKVSSSNLLLSNIGVFH